MCIMLYTSARHIYYLRKPQDLIEDLKQSSVGLTKVWLHHSEFVKTDPQEGQ